MPKFQDIMNLNILEYHFIRTLLFYQETGFVLREPFEGIVVVIGHNSVTMTGKFANINVRKLISDLPFIIQIHQKTTKYTKNGHCGYIFFGNRNLNIALHSR